MINIIDITEENDILSKIIYYNYLANEILLHTVITI